MAGGCGACKSGRKCAKKSPIPIESAAKFIAGSISSVVRLSKSKNFCRKALNQAGVCDLSELSGAVELKFLGLLNPNSNPGSCTEIQPVNNFVEQSDVDAIKKDGGDEVVCLSPTLLRDSNSWLVSTSAADYGRLSPETVIIESDDDEDEKMETGPSPPLVCYGSISTPTLDSSEDCHPFDSSPQREWIARTVDMIDSQIENDQCYSSQWPLDEYTSSSSFEDSCDVSQDPWFPDDTPPDDPDWISVTIDLIDNEVGDKMESSPQSSVHETCFMYSFSADKPLRC